MERNKIEYLCEIAVMANEYVAFNWESMEMLLDFYEYVYEECNKQTYNKSLLEIIYDCNLQWMYEERVKTFTS